MVEIYKDAYKIRRNHSEKWKETPSKTAVPFAVKGTTRRRTTRTAIEVQRPHRDS
jgi:TolB-like protein